MGCQERRDEGVEASMIPKATAAEKQYCGGTTCDLCDGRPHHPRRGVVH